MAARPVFDFPIACLDRDAGEVMGAIASATKDTALDGALIRMRLEEIARDVYQSLDVAGLEEMLAPCFHYQLVVGRSGLVVGSGAAASEVSFDEFARARIPKDVDAEAVIALARGYLNDAAVEEAEDTTA